MERTARCRRRHGLPRLALLHSCKLARKHEHHTLPVAAQKHCAKRDCSYEEVESRLNLDTLRNAHPRAFASSLSLLSITYLMQFLRAPSRPIAHAYCCSLHRFHSNADDRCPVTGGAATVPPACTLMHAGALVVPTHTIPGSTEDMQAHASGSERIRVYIDRRRLCRQQVYIQVLERGYGQQHRLLCFRYQTDGREKRWAIWVRGGVWLRVKYTYPGTGEMDIKSNPPEPSTFEAAATAPRSKHTRNTTKY